MIISRNTILFHVLTVTCLWAIWECHIATRPKAPMLVGPDVIVGDLPNISRWGTDADETAFSIGTTSCNIGDAPLDWIQNSTLHPVISQNLYRVKNGRIEQLGMSWLKHGFSVAAGSECGSCTDFASSYLAVGCSDPYGSSLNGSQGGLGPRSQVNAATGEFTWPKGNLPQTGSLDGRLRVFTNDINPSLNAGARYFAESMYVHPQDAVAGNDNNNASYREVFVSSASGGWTIGFGAPTTVRENPAINAWKAVHPDVRLFAVDVPNDGRIIVGMRSTPISGGFHTEFAIENLNSHQSVRLFRAEHGSTNISNPGFRDVDYQFEPYSGTDWTSSIVGNHVEWSTSTFASNANANALRWNTLYSFWCDSAQLPTRLTLGLFRSGTVSEMSINLAGQTVVPAAYKLKNGIASGPFANLSSSNNQYFELSPNFKSRTPTVELVLQGQSPGSSIYELAFRLEASTSGALPGHVIQLLQLLDQTTGEFETVDERPASTTDQPITIVPTGNLSRFVQPGTNQIQARIEWRINTGVRRIPTAWKVNLDEAVWTLVTN
jgi:hypothetical protein